MAHVRLYDGQNNLVRFVPGAVHVIRTGGGFRFRLNLQGEFMLNGNHAGEGIDIAVGRDLNRYSARHPIPPFVQ